MLILLFIFIWFDFTIACSSRFPIVFVPAFMSSSLHIKSNIPSSIQLPSHCPHQLEGQIWLNLKDGIPLNNTQCFFKYFTPFWNNSNKHFESLDGVQIYYKDFPSIEGISSLGPKEEPIVQRVLRVWYKMIQQLKRIGYKDKKSLFGLGYDWRYADVNYNNWSKKVKEVIESAYILNNKKVMIVTHSLGGPMALQLLFQLGDSFCEKYIEKIITISAPFIGTIKALRSFLSGETEGIPVNPLSFRNFERNIDSVYQLMPNYQWWNDTILIFNGTSYSASQMNQILNLINETKDYASFIYTNAMNRYPINWTPKVKLYCLYSSGIETEVLLNYSTSFDNQPIQTFGDGDGTVPLNSLSFCKTMNLEESINIGKYDHFGIIKAQKTIDYVIEQSCKTT
ncbi:lecithin:cholesterol acyltransferase domain containing protein [Entamoeba histolytica HM-1:IMSS-B]|uniref:Lecithin:cholesterol acyltransferase domain-containing protein n=6 Tax=Entamoeba histolytica TaxID=5759 RepID=C4M045_ENTH1|nr:lecithin:cholesterol acyltransferase domain-containing protein [Entamoeba histolytica HM-1:IMSS]EMD44526.1 lecithin:cholesterol acyltransferase domain containing protein, putative [Entamoeba histolytica KU27]EMH73990.1 lecithin:cholesterol acyltransferase domain containing protein [Entamoeba histolytica HM-1:IMSS-B]EMS13147.1 lecithin:cholesterol acyltransferase domain containing protein [Entamoeba histolytica HM-3:IMSS]ENY61214.1 lecithin:cholesterol acyltransferase domain containing protei|eukprot:XP_655369.1 lecithin:cholesterol acyltransferase domain-containing protein [Entamoeba histolytica HM-1:IMSS]